MQEQLSAGTTGSDAPRSFSHPRHDRESRVFFFVVAGGALAGHLSARFLSERTTVTSLNVARLGAGQGGSVGPTFSMTFQPTSRPIRA